MKITGVKKIITIVWKFCYIVCMGLVVLLLAVLSFMGMIFMVFLRGNVPFIIGVVFNVIALYLTTLVIKRRTLWVYITFFVMVIILCLVLMLYYVTSDMCGFVNEKRFVLNDDLEVVNVLHSCGATTSYTNRVYIVPKNMENLKSKYIVFSAYRCYENDVSVSILDKNKVRIDSCCDEFLQFNPEIAIKKHHIKTTLVQNSI